MNPATAQMVAAGVAAAGGVYQGYTQYQAGKYNAAVMRQQAEAVNYQMADAAKREEQEEIELQRERHAIESRAKALAAASGLDWQSGSFASTLAGIRQAGMDDVVNTRANLQSELYSARTMKWGLMEQARLSESAGRSAFIGSALAAAGDTMLMGYKSGWIAKKKPAIGSLSDYGMSSTLSWPKTPYGFNRSLFKG